jgi:hypothetical protein
MLHNVQLMLHNNSGILTRGTDPVNSEVPAQTGRGRERFHETSGDGAITSRVDRNLSQPLQVPKSLQHWYPGATTVTIPGCGASISVPAHSFLKYNPCAFQGETLTGANGSIIPSLYWIGDQPQSQGFLRLNRRTNVDFSLRWTFPLVERFNLVIAAEATNVLNHTEINAAPIGGLGGVNLLNDQSAGQIPGIGTNGGYGTFGKSAYDPRQITAHTIIQF